MMRAMDSDVEIEVSRQAGKPIPTDNSSSSKERVTAGESQMFDKLPRSIQNRRQQQREQPDWIKLLPVVAATVQDQNQSTEKYQPHGDNRQVLHANRVTDFRLQSGISGKIDPSVNPGRGDDAQTEIQPNEHSTKCERLCGVAVGPEFVVPGRIQACMMLTMSFLEDRKGNADKHADCTTDCAVRRGIQKERVMDCFVKRAPYAKQAVRQNDNPDTLNAKMI